MAAAAAGRAGLKLPVRERLIAIRDGAALQAKLDGLIRVTAASNMFIGIEHLTEQEVEEFRLRCERAGKRKVLEEKTR